MIKTIATPSETIHIIKKYDFQFNKKLGQNFLIDNHVINKIITKSDIIKEDFILEIGPGIGSLTQALAQCSKYVLAVEKDRALIPILQETLADYCNIEIINGDILQLDIYDLILKKNNGNKIKVVANLPYYITTPIIMELLEEKLPITSITVMVQKEVAERITASPATPSYGAITLAANYYANSKIIANVPQNCFIPRPKVASAVLRLDVLEKPPVKVNNEKLMFKIIKAAFGQRRKTILNALFNLADLGLSKEEISEAIRNTNIDTNVRGEQLDLNQFAQLSNNINKQKG